jgi:hypothetical protein
MQADERATGDLRQSNVKGDAMNRVVHFELPADDPERAAGLYREVFGCAVDKGDGPVDYWLVTTGGDDEPGINGGIKRRPEQDVGTINTLGVASIDECLGRIQRAGGTIVMPKTEIPGVGFHAYCRDTEGNVFGLMESTPGPSAP